MKNPRLRDRLRPVPTVLPWGFRTNALKSDKSGMLWGAPFDARLSAGLISRKLLNHMVVRDYVPVQCACPLFGNTWDSDKLGHWHIP